MLDCGMTPSIDFGATVLKLVYRVLIPLGVGQVLQFFAPTVKNYVKGSCVRPSV